MITWGFSGIGTVLVSGKLAMDKERFYCFLKKDENNSPTWKLTLAWITWTSTFIIPFITIVLWYTNIVFPTTSKMSNAQNTGENQQNTQLVAMRTKKIVKSLVLIKALFSVGILPEMVYFGMIFYDRKYIDAQLF